MILRVGSAKGFPAGSFAAGARRRRSSCRWTRKVSAAWSNRSKGGERFFLDSAEIDEILVAARWGVLAGVTTNPTSSPRWEATTTKCSSTSARSHPGL